MVEDNPVVDSIRHSIEKNGFPLKGVKLPFLPIYESCKRHGGHLAGVLDQLRREGITACYLEDHILFQTPKMAAQRAAAQAASGPGLHPLTLLAGGWNPLGGMGSLAAQVFQNMSPEQLEMLRGQVESLGPEEKEKIMNLCLEMFSWKK